MWELERVETELWKAPPDPFLESIAAFFSSAGGRWDGTASDLCLLLHLDCKPNVLSLRLSVGSVRLLRDHDIHYKASRNYGGRKISLWREMEPDSVSNAYRHDRLYSDRIFRRLDEKQLRCAYVMVWALSWGMSGAAPATIIGQAVTIAASVVFFLVKLCRLRLLQGRELGALWRNVLKVALSPFGLTFFPTITMPRMNRFLLLYGNEQAVAVYGCIGYITAIIYLRPDREIEMELCDSTRNKSEFCMVSQRPLD